MRAFLLCLCCALLVGPRLLQAADADQPNIIVLNFDDVGPAWFPPYARRVKPGDVETKICDEYAEIHKSQGAFDLGKHLEAAQHSTPFIDSLAQGGVVFDRCFATSSLCAPSRSGLLTGRYQQSWGAYSIPDVFEVGIPADVPVAAEVFKKAGYVCGAVGKWHVAEHDPKILDQAPGMGREKRDAARALGYETSSLPGQGPLDRGFDYFFGYNNHASAYYGADDLWDGRERVPKRPDNEFLTDLFNGKCAAFVQQQVEKKQKFVLYYAPMALHGALLPPPEKYSSQFHTGIDFTDQYAGHLLAVDEGIRKIYEILAAHGQDKNTLFLMSADNGQTFYRVPPYNAPYRGGKGTGWLGGSHEPLIVSWPAKLHPMVRPEIVSTMDIFTTAMDAAGLKPLKPIDGRSLLPLMLGQAPAGPHDEIFGSGLQAVNWSSSYFETQPDAVKIPAAPKANANAEKKGELLKGRTDEDDCPLFAFRLSDDSLLMYISKTMPGLYAAFPNGRPEQKLFYQIKTDPAENKNLFASSGPAVKKASDELKRWLGALKAPATSHEADYKNLNDAAAAAAAQP